MAKSRRTRIPSLRYHKASGLAVVTLSGRDHYLGPWDAPDAQERYQGLVARWLAGGRRPLAELDAGPDGTPALTVGGLCDRFEDHARRTYRKRGEPTSYVQMAERVLRVVRRMHGSRPAAKYGRAEFSELRNYYLNTTGQRGKPYSRTTINNYCDVARAMFRWGWQEGLVPAAVWYELSAARRIAKGRTSAPETPPVRVPDIEAVRLVQEFVPAPLRVMIEVQLLTGMRPGEACGMRVCDVRRDGPIWHYHVSPEVNKAEHRDAVRIVSIGPKAQEQLRRWIDTAARLRGPAGYVFVTRQGNPYSSSTYGDLVAYQCTRLGLDAGKRWTPNALRHFAATAIRKRFGLDATQATLGHADAKTTEIYAEVDTSAADRVAEEMG